MKTQTTTSTLVAPPETVLKNVRRWRAEQDARVTTEAERDQRKAENQRCQKKRDERRHFLGGFNKVLGPKATLNGVMNYGLRGVC